MTLVSRLQVVSFCTAAYKFLTSLQRLDSVPVQTHGACYHTAATAEFPHGRVSSRNDYDPEDTKRKQREARLKSTWPSERVGYPANDTRYAVRLFSTWRYSLLKFSPVSKANRAGTRGFRAPEVLFKCSEQTGGTSISLMFMVTTDLVCSNRRLGGWDDSVILLDWQIPLVPMHRRQ